ncbi:VanW family protein [Calderihabitans maritimus]|uniref:VanW family protein n=1 Tax=Calderihabitans maritimus TaxID=1246530 RepID=A0A1Z5HXG0_9FIRM|nr:VanW family protein [Calderihabitans maritimus]GAW94216.1 VanW family protein [Calderihabitans maritimus]
MAVSAFRRHVRIFFGTVLLILSIWFLSVHNQWLVPSERIHAGVHVNGFKLGGLSAEEADSILRKLAEHWERNLVILLHGENSWRVTYGELGIAPDLQKIIDEALAVGNEGSWLSRLRERWHAGKKGWSIGITWKMEEEQAKEKIHVLTRELEVPPQDARLVVKEDDTVEVIPSRPGRKVNLDKALRDLRALLKASGSNDLLLLKLETVEVPERISTQDILNMQIKGLIASYSTGFNPNNKERVHNLRLAAEALNNYLIEPGEIFSFNTVVGPRTAVNGYKEALIIKNREFVPGMGGGVCQVSSTLYNAALRANLSIIERRRHSLPVKYVPLGTDATVAYGLIDLKFQNNTGGHLLIRTRVDRDRLTVKIFGNPENQPKVTIVSRVIETMPPKVLYKVDTGLPPGKNLVEREGTPGYKTEVVRIAREGNKVVKKEIISRDIYPPEPAIVRVPPQKSSDVSN